MISGKVTNLGIPLTNQQVRLSLGSMKEKGLVHIGKGRAGIKITAQGVEYLFS